MTFDSVPQSAVEVKLDGLTLEIPAERRTLGGICSFLESVALHQHRILCSLAVDGAPINLTQPPDDTKTFASIEAETMGLSDVPSQLIKAALQQTISLRDRVQSAVGLVMINERKHAHELWWGLSLALKEPLLTLSLLPENIYGATEGQASLTQLRKWQLEQLGAVIQDVNNACEWDSPTVLSDVLETRVLPWIDRLQTSLTLWHETVMANARSTVHHGKHAH
ncbi:MAG: hypothetical protein JWM99_1074 [Verrucomicrobiales bacterium]|nr:hypothetical protein [Verrucomicrobiales bacterium]